MGTKEKILEALENKRAEAVWELIEKAIQKIYKKSGKIDFTEAKEGYSGYEEQVNDKENRYIIVEHYNIDDGFYCRFYSEEDGRHFGDMLTDYFSDVSGSEEILLVDMKKMKCYLMEEEVKYHKKEVKIK